MKQNMSETFLFILLFQMLATSCGLTRPSSGQIFIKLKNAGAYNIFKRCKYMVSQWPIQAETSCQHLE